MEPPYYPHLGKNWGTFMCSAIEQALKAEAAAAHTHLGGRGVGDGGGGPLAQPSLNPTVLAFDCPGTS